MKTTISLFFVLSGYFVHAQDSLKENWSDMKPLFNGTDLNGWYTFLPSRGKNNDPEKIFLVENGLLHISGKEFGYIGTEKIFSSFRLVAEFKWGTKKYPPRDADTTKRDNGICFFMPVNHKDTVWPKSVEFQIQEGDVGDFWLISGATIVVDGKRTVPQGFLRVQKKADGERPTGEWNRVEVIARDGKLTYIVNGIIVNNGEASNLTEGKIIIQSEGAEIFYRKIEIAELR